MADSKEKDNPYMHGKMIEPLVLEGNESVGEFIDNVFGNSGYNARRLGEASELYVRMLKDDAMICLTVAGAMTPIGMSGPISKMMEKGFVDFIISTGANLYHDLHRTFDYPVRQGDVEVDDEDLNKHGVARIYDTYILDDETLMSTDSCIHESIMGRDYPEPISTAELHRIIGEYVLKKSPHPEKSILANAVKYNVPIYTSSPGDSSIGMNLVPPWLFGKKVPIDPIKDIVETTAMVSESKKNGVIIVGGGSPKNFYLQTQPTLCQILWDNRGGHDYFIQLTTDSPQWGGLSGATPQEAKSWGKVKDPKRNSVVVYSCASITYPLLCQYLLLKSKARERKELYKKRDEMVDVLRERLKKNKSLLESLKAGISKEAYEKTYGK
ncbi:MAG: deoxyhypusine synthase [Candidatus Micrarchaeota archaeon]